jgi:hypothetical protein
MEVRVRLDAFLRHVLGCFVDGCHQEEYVHGKLAKNGEQHTYICTEYVRVRPRSADSVWSGRAWEMKRKNAAVKTPLIVP